MLGNFGKLNGLWGAKDNARLNFMLDELLALAAQRAGGVAWEYYFTLRRRQAAVGERARRGHRRPGARARRHAAAPRGRGPADRPAGARHLQDEARRPASACPRAHGDHYAIYSFAPGLRVLNGFIQSLVGLYDYARLSKDPLGTAAVPGRRAGSARGDADLRHRRLVAVLARDVHARVDALLPRPARGLPRRPLHAHEDRRLLHDRRPLRRLQERAARSHAAHARACAAARTAA